MIDYWKNEWVALEVTDNYEAEFPRESCPEKTVCSENDVDFLKSLSSRHYLNRVKVFTDGGEGRPKSLLYTSHME